MNRIKILNSTWFKIIRKIFWDNDLIRYLSRKWNDVDYLKACTWWQRLEKLELSNPLTFSQKLQWIKVYYRDDLMTICADKYLVRDFIIERLGALGNSILNELYGAYSNPEQIDLNILPRSFVIKANHGSGWNIIVKDKNLINWNKYKRTMAKWLKKNYYYYGREYQYKNIEPKIICEKYLINNDGSEIFDYKFMCFNGKVTSVWIDYDRHSNHKRNFYNLDGTPQFYISDEPADYSIPFVKPPNYELMIEIAEKLSKGFPHVRIDLYNVDGNIYFGEMTFTSWGGVAFYRSNELNIDWGNLLNLNYEK